MERLSLLGLNHTTAPLEVREKLVFDTAQIKAAITAFRAAHPDCEIVLLSTCNRVELYTTRPAAGEGGNGSGIGNAIAGGNGSGIGSVKGNATGKVNTGGNAIADGTVNESAGGNANAGGNGSASADGEWPKKLAGLLAELRGIRTEDFAQSLYHKTAAAAVEHLFHVAASMDSMVLGETQILGQVRNAYGLSRDMGAAGPLLHPLFQRAVAVGKEVQSQTPLGEGRMSVASVAVDYAKRIFDTFTDKTVLCIGAGKMSALVLQHLAALGPRRLIVCNRDGEKARLLAERFAGEASDLEHLAEHLSHADIVVSGTGSPRPLITRAMFDGVMKKRRYKPAFLIDIALPRDVEAAVGEADNVYLYNLDDLQQAVAATHHQRREAVDAAAKIVAEHVRQFAMAEKTRELGPAIDGLYRRYHAVAQEELGRTLAKMPGIDADAKAQLQEMMRRLVNKVLHDPVRALRQSDALHGPNAQYLHAMEMLFKLNEPPGNEGE